MNARTWSLLIQVVGMSEQRTIDPLVRTVGLVAEDRDISLAAKVLPCGSDCALRIDSREAAKPVEYARGQSCTSTLVCALVLPLQAAGRW